MFLPGNLNELIAVVVKSALLYLTAIIAFRLSKRRTLAEMSPFDFVAAVAAGAIVGRVPNASGTSYVAGALTLLTILVLHGVITKLRYFVPISRLIDHSPRILFANGRIIEGALKSSGLTEADLFGLLRQNGITDLEELQYLVFEKRGRISILRRVPGDHGNGTPGLVCDILSQCGIPGQDSDRSAA